jgi:enterochelin esterase family protein
MSHSLIIFIVMAMCAASLCVAQTTQPAVDSKPASTNIPGQQYPRIDSDGRAIFRVNAPNAQSVHVNLRNTALTKGDDGVWTGVTEPLDPGFHYYQLIIDGVSAADPSSESFYGSGKMTSGIEVPENGVDFYDVKDVPHGEVRSRWFVSKSTNQGEGSVGVLPSCDKIWPYPSRLISVANAGSMDGCELIAPNSHIHRKTIARSV